ncbi:MAG: phage holin family protein [Taibaiella sp.]|nr:phage holin family protein [Taibaiella sp.]
MFSNLKEKISRHIQVRIDLVRLEVVERSSALMSHLLFALICLFVFFAILLFVGFGLAEVLYDIGLSRGISFLITTGIYILLFVLVVLLRRNIIGFFSDTFIRVMTEGNDEDEQDAENGKK